MERDRGREIRDQVERDEEIKLYVLGGRKKQYCM